MFSYQYIVMLYVILLSDQNFSFSKTSSCFSKHLVTFSCAMLFMLHLVGQPGCVLEPELKGADNTVPHGTRGLVARKYQLGTWMECPICCIFHRFSCGM